MSQRVRDVGYEVDVLDRKFGQVLNVDIADTPTDVYDHGGNGNVPVYPWIATASVLTVVSSSTDDDGDPDSNTGAHTVTIEGVDDAAGTQTGVAYGPITETVTMNGVGVVTTTKKFWRPNLAFVASAGSGGVNAGNIDIKEGANIVARIATGNGQTLQAIFTVPDRSAEQLTRRFLAGLDASFTGTIPGSASVTIKLQRRLAGTSSWRVVVAEILTVNHPAHSERVSLALAIGTDLRWVITAAGVDDNNIVASFDILDRP